MIDYENMCPICLNTFKSDSSGNHIDIGITECNHKYCLTCIIRHGKRRNTCPLCRHQFLDPYNFSPRAFYSDDELIVANNISFNIDIDQQEETEINTWYYGEQIQEVIQEVPPPPPTSGITINNITFDPSNIHLHSNYFAAFDEEYSVEEDDEYLEPEPESEPEPLLLYHTLNNEPYDEIISLSNSDASSSEDELL